MFANPKLAAAAGVALLLGACAAGSTRQSTAEQLTGILAGAQRSEANRARDVYRHPKETLLFFGIRPEMKVLEVWPEPGWYTEIIAPLLRDKGQYYAAVIAAGPGQQVRHRAPRGLPRQAGVRARDLYGHVQVVTLPTRRRAMSCRRERWTWCVTFRNIHNWMARGTARAGLRNPVPGAQAGRRARRRRAPRQPGGAAGPEGQERLRERGLRHPLIEAQGFRLVAKSEINANPKDTKDYEQGVWTLPPTYRLGDKDREKYAAIGESDRFTLRFVKPAR